jgi:hypothetical protein
MNLLRTLAAGTLVLVAACGSDKEPAATATQSAAATAPASADARAASAGTSADDVSTWVEDDSAATTPVSSTPERLANPDAVIDR